MSEWTVSADTTNNAKETTTSSGRSTQPKALDKEHVDLLHDVLQRVGVDDDEEGVPSNFVSPSKQMTKRETANDSPLAESGVPVPLNPADLTPSRDPLEGFTAWIRGQPTPGSHGQSPTPPGHMPTSGGVGVSGGVSGVGYTGYGNNGGGSQRLNYTPQGKYGTYARPTDPASVFANNSTPTRVQQALMPNGTPMHLGTPTSPYPHGGGAGGVAHHHHHHSMQDSPGHYYGAGGGGYYGGGAGGGGGYSPGSHMDADRMMYDQYGGAPMTVESIRGRVYETAKDQHGCRYLQRLLDSAPYENGEFANQIMVEIVPHVAELMTDQYANFLVQKLFDMMPQDVRFRVAEVAAPYMSQIALTPHGTFSIQKLIETIATREEMEIVQQSLAKDVVELVKDVHGNHVIQKVLQRFEHDDKQFIYDAMAADCVPIATNKQGCCVLQRCLEFASDDQRIMLVRAVVECSQLLVQDPFGNYVVQYVLEANDTSVNDAIAKVLLPNFVPLCMNKFSSNVVEKILRVISPVVRDEFVTHLRDPSVLTHLLQDDYGNYVVQTSLNVATPQQADILVQLIRPQMHLIRNAPYAKKLEAKMDLVLRKHRGGPGGGGGGGGGMRHSYSGGNFSNNSGRGGGDSPMSYGGSAQHSPVQHPSPGGYGSNYGTPQHPRGHASGLVAPMGHLQHPFGGGGSGSASPAGAAGPIGASPSAQQHHHHGTSSNSSATGNPFASGGLISSPVASASAGRAEGSAPSAGNGQQQQQQQRASYSAAAAAPTMAAAQQQQQRSPGANRRGSNSPLDAANHNNNNAGGNNGGGSRRGQQPQGAGAATQAQGSHTPSTQRGDGSGATAADKLRGGRGDGKSDRQPQQQQQQHQAVERTPPRHENAQQHHGGGRGSGNGGRSPAAPASSPAAPTNGRSGGGGGRGGYGAAASPQKQQQQQQQKGGGGGGRRH